MARIQILPLPTVKWDDLESTPFVIILDQIANDEAWTAVDLDSVKHETGAVTVLGHHGTLDAPGSLQLSEEQQANLLAFITQPRRWVLGDPEVDYAGRAEATAIGHFEP